MKEQNDPWVSVIMPFYNGDPELLKEAVESVLGQIYSDFELLLVNDGSDTSYDSLLQDICGQDARIRLISQPNGGVSSARNHGVREAHGEYVTFVDTDDLVMPWFLESAVKAAKETGAEFVIGGVSRKDNRMELPQMLPYQTRVLKDVQLAEMRKHWVADMIKIGDAGYYSRGPVGRLVRTSIASQVPFHEEIAIGEDIVWNLELMEHYQKACFVEQIWYFYYDNASSATRKYDMQMFSKCDTELKRIGELLDLTSDEEYRAFVNHIYEELQRFISCSFRWDVWRQNGEVSQRTLHDIYLSHPWKMMTDGRYGRLVKGKRKLRYILHKMKLYMPLYSKLGSQR